MSTRVDGALVRCTLCNHTKRFSYRGYFDRDPDIGSREADAAALSDAKAHAKAHAKGEHGIDLDRVPYERKCFPRSAPRWDIYVKQYGEQVA